MADRETKTEISKEVLAPAEEIREDLVATAVKFLQNAKVQQSALSQKKAFLQRKGLTTEEIEIAVKRAGVQQNNAGTTAQSSTGYKDVVAMTPGTAPDVPVRAEEVSKWMKARHILAVVTMVSGISYAAYKLYKEFLGPWLFGVQTADKRLEKLEKIVAESVTNVNTTLTSIEETLGKQQEKLQMLSHDVNSKMGGESSPAGQNSASISEIKSELSSIKGLLLNRRQFPAMPTSTPTLPAWQLPSNSGDADSNNKGKKDTEESTPEITLSSNPAPESPVKQDDETDYSAKDQDVSELSMSEKDSGIVTKNSNTEAEVLENEANGGQNVDESEKESQRSEVIVTENNDDSEGNESLD
ncbi:peroxisomal membrane protein PEX14-like [Mercenaria mercenaria]|uniref:peroxisomal membrane protein PEX14-like n=1 Tax=Mercenaria mercenaria TaxID=6596 RepID=UPI00234E6604|nr:peroxisomal membrane protein PEX14-like [Mercenaria mercenaria]